MNLIGLQDRYLKRNGRKITGRHTRDYFTLNTVKPLSIGNPTEIGFGVGVPAYGTWNADLAPMPGTYIKGDPQYGNFIHSSTGSVMVCIVPFYVAINANWANGEPLYLVKDFDSYENETAANEDGYYMPGGFYNGGDVCPIYMDKYLISKKALGTGYVGASIKYGNPISTHADHNPIADLTACSVNQYYELVNAAHARDGENANFSHIIAFHSQRCLLLCMGK